VIHVKDSGFGAGTIVVAAALQPRYYEFTMSLEGLYCPVGTKLLIERSCDITQNFNKGIKAMLGDWVWFLGDDHSFAPDLLMKFLKHDVDVVVPITPCKVMPWMPCVMHGPEDPARGFWHEDMLLYDWDELSGEGLMELPNGDFIGQAGMLVKKPVLDRIGYPWFKAGQLDPGRLQEDMTFCHELQQLGYKVWVDRDVIFDHYFYACVTAQRFQGKWVPALRVADKMMVLPDAKPKFNPNRGQGTPRVRWDKLPDEQWYIDSLAAKAEA
jgi:hypothetical protein